MLKSAVRGVDEEGREKSVLLLGLEPRNLELLKQGRPVSVDLRELNARLHADGEREAFGFPDHVEVVIFYGETKEEMMALISEGTTAEPDHR